MSKQTKSERFNKFMNYQGKGSNRRKEAVKKVRDNWDSIAGFKKSKY
jgi:hypothetical protein